VTGFFRTLHVRAKSLLFVMNRRSFLASDSAAGQYHHQWLLPFFSRFVELDAMPLLCLPFEEPNFSLGRVPQPLSRGAGIVLMVAALGGARP